MQKILTIMLGVVTALASVVLYCLGKKTGKQEVENKQIKEENKVLSDEVDNAKEITKIETDTKLASDDDVIDGLREWTTEDHSK